jgi:ribosomal protein L39E
MPTVLIDQVRQDSTGWLSGWYRMHGQAGRFNLDSIMVAVPEQQHETFNNTQNCQALHVKLPRICTFFQIFVLFLSHRVFSQGNSFSGKVMDNKANPVSSAPVLIKGTSAGFATDDQGRFHIPFPGSDRVTLLITSVGFAGQAGYVFILWADSRQGVTKKMYEEAVKQNTPIPMWLFLKGHIFSRLHVNFSNLFPYADHASLDGPDMFLMTHNFPS